MKLTYANIVFMIAQLWLAPPSKAYECIPVDPVLDGVEARFSSGAEDTLSEVRRVTFTCWNNSGYQTVGIYAVTEQATSRGAFTAIRRVDKIIEPDSAPYNITLRPGVTIPDTQVNRTLLAEIQLQHGTWTKVTLDFHVERGLYPYAGEKRTGHHPVYIDLEVQGNYVRTSNISTYVNVDNPTCKFDPSQLEARGDVLVLDGSNSAVALPDVALSYQCEIAGTVKLRTSSRIVGSAGGPFVGTSGNREIGFIYAELTADMPDGPVPLRNGSELLLRFPSLPPVGTIPIKGRLLPNETTRFGRFQLNVAVNLSYP